MRRIALLAGMLALFLASPVPSAHAATTRAVITWDKATDVDLHVYDSEDNHAYYGDPTAIPQGTLSPDVRNSGGPETFADEQEPSIRSFQYRVCYYELAADLGAVDVALTITNARGASHDETFTLDAPGACLDLDEDNAAPAVTLETPGDGVVIDDATPRLTGSAGTAPGDLDDVQIALFAGSSATGQPVQTLDASVVSVTWSFDASSLSDGEYTAEATQSDDAGNNGTSGARSFTVRLATAAPGATTAPEQHVLETAQDSAVPIVGQTVVAGAVSGTVRVKGKNGRFRTLGANESIPLGSTVDATNGKVKLTSAAGAGGRTQSALFYQGAFVVTQTRGAKPITQLALAGKLRCAAKGRASTSARRRVRRLWGDGKGRFRTRGRHGAATVKGTKWLTEDRCNGTYVRVKRGVVSVRDYTRRKTVTVKKGKSYLARARRGKR